MTDMTEKYVRLPDREELQRRLKAVDDPHCLLKHFHSFLTEHAGVWVSALFLAAELILVVKAYKKAVPPESRRLTSGLVSRLITAVVDDWDVAQRAKLVFSEFCPAPQEY